MGILRKQPMTAPCPIWAFSATIALSRTAPSSITAPCITMESRIFAPRPIMTPLPMTELVTSPLTSVPFPIRHRYSRASGEMYCGGMMSFFV